nr:alpha-(1,3)-fucosyltransferase 6-like [Ciona intestinalis]|eukprot:XP_018669093.1 alpha-(1,3)-fucosyltransferase 6-like [Ciona intestinalis]
MGYSMKYRQRWKRLAMISAGVSALFCWWVIHRTIPIRIYSRQQSARNIELKSSDVLPPTTVPTGLNEPTPKVIQYSKPAPTTTPKKKPLILYWGTSYDDAGLGAECSVTYDQSRLPEADAVLFHFTKIGKNDIPWRHYRDKHQIFVWWCAEAPANFGREALLEFDGGFFNWTWTYMRSADAHRTYGFRKAALDFVTKGNQTVNDIISHKKKMALWGVSHCGGSIGANKRMEYYKALVAAGLEVTAYGGCFPGSENIPRPFPMLFEPKWKEHKFYFAFENAIHCRDYITEKFWDNALKNDMVPVVWGPTKEDVLSVAPLDSFIHTDDFDSPAKLAEYLQFLDKNDDEYRKYFRWREDETMTDEKMIRMTQEKYPNITVEGTPINLCKRLIENQETKIIDSLNAQFILSEQDKCLI